MKQATQPLPEWASNTDGAAELAKRREKTRKLLSISRLPRFFYLFSLGEELSLFDPPEPSLDEVLLPPEDLPSELLSPADLPSDFPSLLPSLEPPLRPLRA
jgi:hypothetical protein